MKNWYSVVDEKHFWFKYRYKIIYNFLQKYFSNKKEINKVLDIGCGSAVFANQFLKDFNCHYIGVDKTNKISNNLNIKFIEGDFCHVDIDKLGKFEIIFLLDIIEHLDQNKINVMLKKSLDLLTEKGIIVLNVPSIQRLYSNYDKAVGHKRRYTIYSFKNDNSSIVKNIINYNYWGITLLPVVFLRKITTKFFRNEKKIIKHGMKSNFLINLFFSLILKIEYLFKSRIKSGSSLMIILKKK